MMPPTPFLDFCEKEIFFSAGGKFFVVLLGTGNQDDLVIGNMAKFLAGP